MDGKKKILFVVEAMGGGVFTYIVDLANGLAEKYDMYIAYAIRPQTPSDYRDYFDSRIHLIEVKNFTRSVESSKEKKAFLQNKRIAHEVKPDIIHLHSSKAGALGRWAFNGKKTPLFYTPHGYSFLMKNYSTVKRFTYKMVETVSGLRSCITISCSEGEHQETLKLTRKATYVDNGINMEQLDSLLASIKEESHPFTVFTLGRICYQKNPMLFNDIAKALPDVPFIRIGAGELREELSSPNIEITGWLDRKNALSRSVSADVFLLTSLWEGLPISLLEAMYMRKPCVVNDVIGNHDVIHNGVNGYVCQNVSEFAESIEAVRNNKDVQNGKSAGLVDAAYEDILNKYNTVVMAEKYSAIYDEALVRFGGGGINNYYIFNIYYSVLLLKKFK
ncbi:MAG: glycosyltransferase, partial [Oscillospiraceae bacterium]|nr:glycosyltransferase [Oscillospiraceae bacterium]